MYSQSMCYGVEDGGGVEGGCFWVEMECEYVCTTTTVCWVLFRGGGKGGGICGFWVVFRGVFACFRAVFRGISGFWDCENGAFWAQFG